MALTVPAIGQRQYNNFPIGSLVCMHLLFSFVQLILDKPTGTGAFCMIEVFAAIWLVRTKADDLVYNEVERVVCPVSSDFPTRSV